MTSGNRIQVGTPAKHIVCFAALPFQDSTAVSYETVLLPALRSVLELYPYHWQVARADDNYFSNTIYDNIAYWLKRADAYIADISELNPNVMMELGYMHWARKPEQPLIVLNYSGAGQSPVDLAGVIRIQYTAQSGSHAIEDVAEELKQHFSRTQSIQTLNASKGAHYLSPLFLYEVPVGADPNIADTLSRKYVTMEAFISADIESIRFHLQQEGLDLSETIITAYKKEIESYLRKLQGL